MSLSRRHFFGNLGLGSVGLLSAPFIIGRGREAMAFEAAAVQPPDDGGFIRISSNENARGPGKKTIDGTRSRRGSDEDIRRTIPAIWSPRLPTSTGSAATTSSSAPGPVQFSRRRRGRSARRKSRSSLRRRRMEPATRQRAVLALRSR